MTLESLLKDNTDYNLWANAQTVNWLKTNPLELMEREIPSSFPTLRDTLLHIWGAEQIWLERLRLIPPTTFLSQPFNGTVEDIFEGVLRQSEEFAGYVQDLPDAKFQEICTFKLLNGTEDSRPRSKMIYHCMNHSTYHRGQIVTMARNLGLSDPPSTDYIKYVRLK
ncbi:MAG: DinB family protein [Saprospiraceae bacterium]|nr:DinB family protein [Saprospiraceae bacterium]